MTAKSWLRRQRAVTARHLLREGWKIEALSAELGFRNPSAVTRASHADQSAAGGTSPDATSSKAEPAADQARIARMDSEVNLIASRLGMSAPMEEDGQIAPGFIERAYAEGGIVDVTLEEVEAAIGAAAKTPGTGDDIDAQVLKHRGSYRFFAPE